MDVEVPTHEPVVIGVAATELGRDADDVPVGRELGGSVWVESQAPSAHLADGDVGGNVGHVDKHVDLRAIPAFAEKPSRPHQQADFADCE